MFSRQGPPPAGGSRRETTHEAYRNDLILAKYIFPSPSLFPIMSLSRWGGVTDGSPSALHFPSLRSSALSNRKGRDFPGGTSSERRKRDNPLSPTTHFHQASNGNSTLYCVNREGGFCCPAPTEEGTRFHHDGQKRHLMWVR